MKKRFICIFVIGIFVGAVLPIYAETNIKDYQLSFLEARLFFDRVEEKTEKPIINFEGEIYVPLKMIAEKFGKEFTYEKENNLVWIGKKPGDDYINLSDIKPRSIGLGVIKDTSETLFNGKNYEKGITFYIPRDSISYNLNENYYYLEGVVGPIIYSQNEKESSLVFYGDGKELLRTSLFIGKQNTKKSEPQNIKIDVRNVKILKIQMDGSGPRLGLMEGKLTY